MPTNRRYRKRRRIVEPPPEPERSNGGFEFLGDPYKDFYRADLSWDEVREIWLMVRQDYLALWTLKQPGTRPWFWWMNDMPEHRMMGSPRLTDGEMRPMTEQQLATYCEYNGGPTVLPDMRIETQTDYLDRCGLLTDQERKALGRETTGQN